MTEQEQLACVLPDGISFVGCEPDDAPGMWKVALCRDKEDYGLAIRFRGTRDQMFPYIKELVGRLQALTPEQIAHRKEHAELMNEWCS